MNKDLKSTLNNLHTKGGGDWESLMNEADRDRKALSYNFAQLVACLCPQLHLYLEWGRGTGKSTFIAHKIRQLVYNLPRASGVLVGSTYQQILTRTLPSTIQALEAQGFYKDLHFFVGRKPPKNWNWPSAYQPPMKHDNYIHFWNGTGIHLVSQDRPGSGRGLNTDFVIGDEAALLDKQNLDADVLLTNRGSFRTVFENNPLHLSTTFTSTTPLTAKGRWFTEMEEQAIIHPTKIKFLKANSFINKANLGEEWFELCRLTMLDWMYNAEILNIRLKAITDGFYPRLNEDIHCYNNFNYSHYEQYGLEDTPMIDCRGDNDIDLDRPLTAGIDFGANINFMVVTQDNGDYQENVLKSFFVLSPKILDDVLNEFATYYHYHQEKKLYLWYDSAGNVSQANSKRTYAQQARDVLTKRGWRVQLMTVGQVNSDHLTKYQLWNTILGEEDPRYPSIKFNRANNRALWVSMTNTPAKRGLRSPIQKNKASERNKKLQQQHSTHGGDAIDVIIVGKYRHLMSGGGGFNPAPIISQ